MSGVPIINSINIIKQQLKSMKRLCTISLLATMPLAMFAYYGDYSGSIELPGTIKFLTFILFVWGILEVILFFKVWGMTNNVKKIQTELTRSNTTELFRKYRLLGLNDKAAEILIQVFLNDMEKYIHSDSYYSGEIIDYKVAELEFQLSQLGEKLPNGFKNLKTAEDYYKLGYMKALKRPQLEVRQKEEAEDKTQVD